ncbi:MAG: energy-coupling factor transporter transmembrane protein EcfT, partial [Nocardioidaceae bacterium]|nr:energy-coupling factor transporter transmembrane protein EcfT [Nocardioidaceae bacterium]
MVAGLAGMTIGAYALLDGTAPRQLATPVLLGAIALGVVGISLSGRGVTRTSYRPDHWRLAELVTAASGLAAGVLMTVTSRVDAANLNPSLSPLTWPQLPWLPLAAILIALLPVASTPHAATVEAVPA